MVKITGNYRWQEGAHFDHAYYQQEHMQLTAKLLQPLGLRRLVSEKTVLSTGPKVGQIVASSNAYFDSLSAAQAALAMAGAALLADVPRYTSLRPELHLCEVTEHV
jgi:uncharacterized protein (TIGR02118 family)